MSINVVFTAKIIKYMHVGFAINVILYHINSGAFLLCWL